MSEVLRPVSIEAQNSWTGAISDINEEVPNDSTFMLGPANAPFVTQGELFIVLGNPVQSYSGAAQIEFRWRWGKRDFNGNYNTDGTMVNGAVRLLMQGQAGDGSKVDDLADTSALGPLETRTATKSVSQLSSLNGMRLRFSQSSPTGATIALTWVEAQVILPRRVTIIL